ncbi:hypothetical protein ACFE04_004820 [Oxalis oulophora]
MGHVVEEEERRQLESAKSLICALNFLSRDLPVPPHLYDAVLSIYNGQPHDDDDGHDDDGHDDSSLSDSLDEPNVGELITDFEDALSKECRKHVSAAKLTEFRESRYQSKIQHRLKELEELPSSRGDDLQSKCLLELYGLKLAELQSKIRTEVSSEYWLRMNCASPEKQLFDWGMMRLRRPLYGIGDAFAMDADDQHRKKRDAERLSRLEEEERNLVETRKRKFFAEILNTVREWNSQIQSSFRRRKPRNDYVLNWHSKQRQRATRAEKMRLQALKADDQEAYMKLVKESKNERLTSLLEETNKLLVDLGAAVQRQKDADGIEPLKNSEDDLDNGTSQEEDMDDDGGSDDLLQGQREYNLAIHSIQEKVTEQPSMLQGGELRQYQIEGLQWMLSLYNNNLNGILADEMGLGKTIQTISLLAYLIQNKDVTGPYLIIAPKAVLPNWISEFSTWAPGIVAILYDGRPDERKAMREELFGEGKFNALITHYDLIIKDKTYLRKIYWQYMIVDEGHRLKNHECALAKTIEGYDTSTFGELWSLLNFLLPNIFNCVQNFEEWFNAPFADRGGFSLTDEEQLLIIRRLHQVIRPFILRRKKDEVEKYLPQKSQVILKCDLSAWQKVYYHQVTDVGRVGLDNGTGKSKSLQNLTMQLRKCCNHPYLFIGEYMWNKEDVVRSSGKFELLDRLLPKLRRGGHRVLLFSQMTRLMDVLEIYLQHNDYKYLRLDGTTKTEERGTLLKKFNAPDSPYFMFLLSTRAGGLGLNLQTADTVIIFDSDWNPQMDQQAEDRAHRIGQKKEVRVFVLVSVGSVEEVILERAKQKMGIDAKVIQAGLFNTTSTAQDRKRMLEQIMRRGTSALGNDVPSEREINRLAARSEEEYWMFEKMDEERRQKENYRSRLMDEHEVPVWAYSSNENGEDKAKGSIHDSGGVLGKRRRKQVVYADTLSDVQWMKAMENGDDLAHLSRRGKRSAMGPSEDNNNESDSNLRNENLPMVSDGTSEETYSSVSRRAKLEGGHDVENLEYQSVERSENWGRGNNMNGHLIHWKTHKKKRSSYVSQSSPSDSRGHHQGNGRGSGWA